MTWIARLLLRIRYGMVNQTLPLISALGLEVSIQL